MWYNICGSVILLIDILVCDDSAEIVEQVKKLLCAWEKVNTVSFNIDCRQSGKFILENKHKYDIAFIDIEMPEMSGLELAVELKKQNPDVLIIVLTSFQRYLDDAMRIHVFRYLSKPVDVNRFNKNLFDAVQEYRTLSKTIILETHDIVKKIKTKDILYIENRRYGALLVTKDAEYATGVRLKGLDSKDRSAGLLCLFPRELHSQSAKRHRLFKRQRHAQKRRRRNGKRIYVPAQIPRLQKGIF